MVETVGVAFFNHTVTSSQDATKSEYLCMTSRIK